MAGWVRGTGAGANSASSTDTPGALHPYSTRCTVGSAAIDPHRIYQTHPRVQMVDVPSRPVGAEEVVVRVAYAGINGGCETFRVRGDHAFAFLRGREGFDLGAEGCGVVVVRGGEGGGGSAERW